MSLKPWSSRTGGSSKIKRQTWRGCDKFSLFMQMLMQQQGHSCFYVSFKKFVFASSFSSTFHSSSMTAWQDGANYKTFKTAILTIWSWSKKVFMYICPKKKIFVDSRVSTLETAFMKNNKKDLQGWNENNFLMSKRGFTSLTSRTLNKRRAGGIIRLIKFKVRIWLTCSAHLQVLKVSNFWPWNSCKIKRNFI